MDRRFTHKVVTQLTTSLVQDRKNSLAETSVLTHQATLPTTEKYNDKHVPPNASPMPLKTTIPTDPDSTVK